MNVDTLLEAAKYLEEQEEKAKQRQIQTIPDIAPRLPIIHQQNHVHLHHQQQQQQQQQSPPQPPPQQQQQPQPLQNLQNHQQTTTTSLLRTSKPDLPNSPLTITTTVPQQQQQQQQPQQPTRVIKNSFDIINRLVIDESGEQKRKQPPIVFRAGTREVHNKLEKDRRAHLKECFDLLKKQLPKAQDERKSSNLSILHSVIRYIHNLKKKERELEHEMEHLARQKIAYQQKIAVLKKDVVGFEGMDLSAIIPELAGAQGTISGLPEEMLMETTPIPEIKLETEDALLMDNKLVKTITSAAVSRSITAHTQQMNGVKENTQVQALSVVPISYPMSQVVLQKVALVPKNLTDLSPLVSSPTAVAHLITPQQIGGKVVPIVNAQYVVKPVVVVSTPSRPS